MGLADFFEELLASLPFAELHAEAPEDKEKGEEDKDEAKDEAKEDKEEGEEGEEKEEGEEGDEDKKEGGEEKEEAEPEEEEEEEPEDPMPKLEEECSKTAQCAPLKHHYDECVERVTAHVESEPHHKGFKEDCVEEFFHLAHCTTQCAAPKLFRQLR